MRYLIVIVSLNVIKYGFYYKVRGLYCTLVDLNDLKLSLLIFIFPSHYYSQCHVVHFITFLFYKKAILSREVL